jgi:hypothetical protein
MDHELALQDLALPKERTYFTLVLIISVAVWVLLAVLIIPIFYALIVAVFIWFANGLLVARLRADGVKVDGDRLPKLHAALRDVCARLEIAQVPDLFVIQSGGLLNAFATRHSGRHFVVIYSDLGANVLVTIAVIGILVGLLLPAVEAARSAARRAACAANLLLIEQAKQQAEGLGDHQVGDQLSEATISSFIPGGLRSLLARKEALIG